MAVRQLRIVAASAFVVWLGIAPTSALQPVPSQGGLVEAGGLLCSGHGARPLHASKCTCQRGWGGDDCSVDACSLMLCAGHSTCEEGICRCDTGFLPPDCAVDTCPGHETIGETAAARGCYGALGHG